MIDEELYKQATDELNSDARKPDVWACACALASDDHNEARFLYTNLRVEEMLEETGKLSTFSTHKPTVETLKPLQLDEVNVPSLKHSKMKRTPDPIQSKTDPDQLFDFLDDEAANDFARVKKPRRVRKLLMPIIRKPIPISESGPLRAPDLDDASFLQRITIGPDETFDFLDDEAADDFAREKKPRRARELLMPIIRKLIPISETGALRAIPSNPDVDDVSFLQRMTLRFIAQQKNKRKEKTQTIEPAQPNTITEHIDIPTRQDHNSDEGRVEHDRFRNSPPTNNSTPMSLMGRILAALSLLTLVDDLGLMTIKGHAENWIEAYSEFTNRIISPLFGWFNFYWIEISRDEYQISVLALLFGTATFRAQYQLKRITRSFNGALVSSLKLACSTWWPVFFTALLLPIPYGMYASILIFLVISFRCIWGDSTLTKRGVGSREIRDELTTVISIFLLIVVVNYVLTPK